MRVLYDQTTDERKVQVVGRASGDPELFADGVHGIQIIGGNVKMNLYTLSTDSSIDNQRREVVARLVLPVGSLFELSDFLADQVAKLRAQGR